MTINRAEYKRKVKGHLETINILSSEYVAEDDLISIEETRSIRESAMILENLPSNSFSILCEQQDSSYFKKFIEMLYALN